MNRLLFIGLGALFWLIGVLFIRFLGPILFIEGSPLLLVLFVVGFASSWVFMQLGAVLGKVRGQALFVATVLMSTTALLLDGAALTWFPVIYGLPAPALVLAAAWLLWTFGAGLLIALLAIRMDAGLG